ncbi:MAG: hypothetical protein NZM31_11245 [Gemmatales bacterium]|nr:hypothetical protein [Gemmatales bacterium]MDW8387572.1 hypothetical protein [Gemmatales bacterium]
MSQEELRSDEETDPRFPSGPWIGFWIQKQIPPGKHEMELHLRFRGGIMTGDGRDWVGKFTIRGSYDVKTGACRWVKQYVGKHGVQYNGYNEGKGIWGRWEIASERLHGGFCIWPEGFPDPTLQHLEEEADPPTEVFVESPSEEPSLVPNALLYRPSPAKR